MPLANGYPTYFERYPSHEAYAGYLQLKVWYPESKYPRLNAQWDAMIKQYEEAMGLL